MHLMTNSEMVLCSLFKNFNINFASQSIRGTLVANDSSAFLCCCVKELILFLQLINISCKSIMWDKQVGAY